MWVLILGHPQSVQLRNAIQQQLSRPREIACAVCVLVAVVVGGGGLGGSFIIIFTGFYVHFQARPDVSILYMFLAVKTAP